MLNQKYENLGKKSSDIRELFEYGKKLKAEIGEENVYDYSLGNPSTEPPKIFIDTLNKLIKNENSVKLHGYTSAAGDMYVRKKIAEYITSKSGYKANENLIYMTCGAAASLTISLSVVVQPNEEVIILAPFFPEYKVFIQQCGGISVVCECKPPLFSIDFEKLSNIITEKTAAIIINSPNNPSGSIITAEEMLRLSQLLKEKQNQYRHSIYLISDEPYRELVYENKTVVYPANFYNNTITCYSFSKSLSVPGERIGYIEVSPYADDKENIFAAVCGAGRSLGYVCAPSLLQFAVAECIGNFSDISVYKKNRSLLYDALTEIGYEAVYPNGAFYLFIKSLEPNAISFCEQAKKHRLLLVPSDSFGIEGYVRIAYCVKTETILNSLKSFKNLYNDYKDGI